MRTFVKLMASAAAAATVTAMAIVPAALADPPPPPPVANHDVIGVGSDTTEFIIDQLSHDFNLRLKASAVHFWSENATNPATGAIGDSVVLKKGCKAIPRPNGSSQGIAALTTENQTVKGHPCIDFARSSRNRQPTDPVYGKGGVAFVTLGGDAETYATQPGTYAPANLTTLDLFNIYTCKWTRWNQVPGDHNNKPIVAFIPQSGSGTRAFFLTAIGIPPTGAPGPCVSDGATKAVPTGTIEENEGVNPLLTNKKILKNEIFPYSIGKYLAERYHSAKCFNTACTALKSGPNKGKVCLPGKGQNLFGCDNHGTMNLNLINGTKPTTPFPLPGKCGKTCPIVNPKVSATFARSLYDVVPFTTTKGSQNGIPGYLLSIFGPKGYVCTNKTAKTDLANYGFIVFPAGTGRGHSVNHCGDTH